MSQPSGKELSDMVNKMFTWGATRERGAFWHEVFSAAEKQQVPSRPPPTLDSNEDADTFLRSVNVSTTREFRKWIFTKVGSTHMSRYLTGRLGQIADDAESYDQFINVHTTKPAKQKRLLLAHRSAA